jgi:hypothetical protein
MVGGGCARAVAQSRPTWCGSEPGGRPRLRQPNDTARENTVFKFCKLRVGSDSARRTPWSGSVCTAVVIVSSSDSNETFSTRGAPTRLDPCIRAQFFREICLGEPPSILLCTDTARAPSDLALRTTAFSSSIPRVRLAEVKRWQSPGAPFRTCVLISSNHLAAWFIWPGCESGHFVRVGSEDSENDCRFPIERR